MNKLKEVNFEKYTAGLASRHINNAAITLLCGRHASQNPHHVTGKIKV